MAREIVMPQLGLSMDAGRIARWLKVSGATVHAGEVVLEVESDKATVEVEAPASGILQVVAGEAGGDVKVGTVIAYLLAEGEQTPGAEPDTSHAVAEDRAAPGADETPEPLARSAGTTPTADLPRPPSSPAARRRAVELGVDWRAARGTGPRGSIRERDVVYLATGNAAATGAPALAAPAGPTPPAAAEAQPAAPRISPLARSLAEAVGLGPEVLAARFPAKRIEREDVELAVRELLAGRVPAAAAPAPKLKPSSRRRPMGRLRAVIAERMTHSAHTAAPVTLTMEVDATELVRLRDAMKDGSGHRPVPSYNVLLAKIVALALLDHPDLNATIEDGTIINWETANIGIAVDTERGLVVPVLRDVTHKSIDRLASEAGELLKRAAEGRATPDELSGGTFTITNLGIYGVDAFTPIINLPECAIMGVGRLRPQPGALSGGSTVTRTILTLSLTFDHRLVDGAPAARFLQRVGLFVEQPYQWLTRTL